MHISVVVTTYNGEKYIIEQLESIKQQTRKADEVLIFDDCSNDSTVLLINDYIASNQLTSWNLYINEKNLGWRKNFMQGIWQAKGDLVFTCDQDDIWETSKLEVMEQYVNREPDIYLLTSRYCEFNTQGRKKVCPEYFGRNIKKQRFRKNFFKVPYPGSTHCITRKLIEESRDVWFEEAPHDAIFWRIALLRHGLYICNDILVNVRKHNSTYTVEARKLRNIDKRIAWVKYAKECMLKIQNYIEEKNIQLSRRERKILESNREWLNARGKLLINKELLQALVLIGYLGCYERKRQYLIDFYLCVRERRLFKELGNK